MNNLKCVKCNTVLNFSNISTIRNINHKSIKACKNCEENVLTELKKKYYVETYKGQEIYCYDGRFVPYWGCTYYFKTIEEAKYRIDNKTCAVVPTELLNQVRRGSM